MNVHEISITDNRRKEKGGEEENRKRLTGGSFYLSVKLEKKESEKKMEKNVMKNVTKKTNEVEIEEEEISKDEKLSWARMAGVWGLGGEPISRIATGG